MNKKKKTIIIGVIVVLVLLGVLAGLKLTEPKDNDNVTSDTSSESSSYTLIEKNETLFESAVITNKTGTFTIDAVDNEDSDGRSYVLTELSKYNQRSNRLSSIVGHCCSIYGMQKVSENTDDLSQYGLDSPSATVEVKFSDGDTFKIMVGNAVYDGSAYYATVDGDNSVYTITTAIAEYFGRDKLYYLESTITQSYNSGEDGTDTPNIRKLTVTRNDLSEPIVIEPFTDKNATEETRKLHSEFKMTSPVEIEINSDYDSKLVYDLFGLEGNEVAGALVTDFAPFGLDKPICTIELKYDSSVMTLLVGDEAEGSDGDYYIAVDGEDIVYTISKSDLTALTCTPKELITAFPVLPYINSLSQIDLYVDGKTYQYDLTLTTDKDGNEVLKTVCDGKELDAKNFANFYQLLLDVKITDINSEAVTSDADMVLTYHYTSGNTEQVKFYKTGEERKAIVEINGKADFIGKSAFITKLAKEAQKLQNGETVDTSW